MNPYEDMLTMPHHVSKTRPQMSMIDRGAQFSPFAALTGYDAVIAESARQTEGAVELTECAVAALDEKLQLLRDDLNSRPWARYTCFLPDQKKAGGSYESLSGCLKKYDSLTGCLILTDDTRIPIDSIVEIQLAEE